MLRVAPEVHAQATIAAEASGKSLNQWAEDLFREATRMEHPEQHLSGIYETGSFRVARRKKRISPKAAQASRGKFQRAARCAFQADCIGRAHPVTLHRRRHPGVVICTTEGRLG